MKRKSLEAVLCPIARSLDNVGEWWSLLIIRDAFHGLRRFDEFQKSLDIAPNMLTRRLNSLVENELLEKHQYSEKPARFEYLLTAKGRDLAPVLTALFAWGNKHLFPDGVSIQFEDIKTGQIVEPVLVDKQTGKEISSQYHRLSPGPAADQAMKDRIKHIHQTHQPALSQKESST